MGTSLEFSILHETVRLSTGCRRCARARVSIHGPKSETSRNNAPEPRDFGGSKCQELSTTLGGDMLRWTWSLRPWPEPHPSRTAPFHGYARGRRHRPSTSGGDRRARYPWLFCRSLLATYQWSCDGEAADHRAGGSRGWPSLNCGRFALQLPPVGPLRCVSAAVGPALPPRTPLRFGTRLRS
jgi:hypothetical protein